MRIGILYICTGKYSIFWERFYKSAEQYLMRKDFRICEYYVFTDSPKLYGEDANSHVHRIYQENLGWPGNSLMRFHMFLSIKERLEQETDSLYFFNANMEFQLPVGDEFFPDERSNGLVGVQHCAFYDKTNNQFPYERNSESTAYIPYGEGNYYYQGSLIGGTTSAFLKMCETLRNNIDEDSKKNIIASWHDESHLNRYFLDNPPSMLTPSYSFHEGRHIPFPMIIKLFNKATMLGGYAYLRGSKTISYKDYFFCWYTRFLVFLSQIKSMIKLCKKKF